MTRLLAQDTALGLFRGHRRITARAAQRAGELSLSAVTVFDIRLWLYNPRTPSHFVSEYLPFMQRFQVRDVTDRIASEAAGLTRFFPVPDRARHRVAALLAATALEHDLVLVTHDQAPFAAFPGLAFEDWTVP